MTTFRLAARSLLAARDFSITAIATLALGITLLFAGLMLGVLAVFVTSRVIESQLFGVSPRDPAVLALAVLAFAGVGLAAIWWPSRRAGALDPAITLRSE